MTQRLSISLPMYNAPVANLATMAKAADAANFEALWAYEFYRSPFLTLAGVAPHTETIKLGTGIVTAFGRSPVVTANEAADVDELSDGRVVLGIGTGAYVEAWHNTDMSSPVARMRDYVAVMRTVWASVGTGQRASYKGEHYKVRLPDVLRRPLVRDDIPVYLAATKPKMLQLTGEIGNGLHGYFFTPRYFDEVVRPNIAIGAERAGRSLDDVDLCNWLICSVHDDHDEAMRRARIQVGFYALGSPHLCEFNGLADEWQALGASVQANGTAGFETTDDKLVEAFGIAGTPDECRDQLAQYDGTWDLVALHTPYREPLTAAEAEESFHAIVDTFGRQVVAQPEHEAEPEES